MKKKILFIVPSLVNAGPVNVCLTLIQNIPHDYDIEVLALNHGEREKEFAARAKVVVFKRCAILKIVHYIRSGNYMTIHSHCTISDIFSYLSFSTARKVTTIHNYFEYDFVQTKGFIKGHLEGIVGRFVVRHFNKVACSLSVKDHCVNVYGMKKVVAIPNGVEAQLYQPVDKPDDIVRFYYLGVLNKRKNVGQILESFNQWCTGKHAQLHIIGTGVDEVLLMQKYSSNKIFFHGHIAFPAHLYVNFDCFVSASLNEGLPLALLESMSAGKSFICSNIAPHVEVLNASPNPAGFVYDKTVAGLIKGLEQYYRSPERNLLALNAISSYQENYSAKKMAERYLDHYQNI